MNVVYVAICSLLRFSLLLCWVIGFFTIHGLADQYTLNGTKFIASFNNTPSFQISSTPQPPTFLAFQLTSLAEVENGTVISACKLSDLEWQISRNNSFSPTNVTTQELVFFAQGPTNSSNEFVLIIAFTLKQYNGTDDYLPESEENFYHMLFPLKPLLHVSVRLKGWEWHSNTTSLQLSADLSLNARIFTTENTTAAFEIDALYFLANNLVLTFPHNSTCDDMQGKVKTRFRIGTKKKPVQANLTMLLPQYISEEEYVFYLRVNEIISGNDLALIIGVPFGVLLVAGLVLFITTYYFNMKFESSEQRELANQRPINYNAIRTKEHRKKRSAHVPRK